MKSVDRIGQVFGRLTVIKTAPNRGRYTQLKCRCECGNEKVVVSSYLVSGDTRSCGCLLKEATITHGHTIKKKSRTYNSWKTMKARCGNKNANYYHLYGGRGIRVCTRWLESFENFLEDMGERPEGRTLDRINNNKGYFKNNCRWSIVKENSNNTRRNVFLKYKGLRKTIAQWADYLKIPQDRIRSRYKRGHKIKEILSVTYLDNRNRGA